VAKLSVLGLFNPYKLWFFVVFVSGLDIIGYLLKKAFSGSTSTLLSATIGGFISSTSTTIGLAQKSKIAKGANYLVAGALLANVVSFVQIAILVAPISLGLLKTIAPFLTALMVVGTAIAVYFLNSKGSKTNKAAKVTTDEEEQEMQHDDSPIFQLGPAIRFAVILTLVKIVATVSLELIGSAGFIVTSLLASLTGIDAITITLADLFNRASIGVTMTVSVFVLINVVNLLSKVVYSVLSGSREFAGKFALGTIAMLVASIAVQYLVR
jgi:uncharacterized membrane protein (DUF4010 family)